MGYQLNCVRLCGVVVVGVAGVTPNTHSVPDPESPKSVGTPDFHEAHFRVAPLPEVVLQLGAVACVTAQTPAATVGSAASVVLPLAMRSAGSCNRRIAFGKIGFGVPVAGFPAILAVGATAPRANPSCSHSLVTATHWLELFRYSTRR